MIRQPNGRRVSPRPGESREASEHPWDLWDYPIFALLSLAAIGAVGLFFWHWYTVEHWRGSAVLFGMLTLIPAMVAANSLLRWYLLPYMRRPAPRVARPGLRVAVITTFVPDHEPLEMLEHTLHALVALTYPHDTWVLDEGDDPRVRRLCASVGAFHYTRKGVDAFNTESGRFQARSKHGNVNAWLSDVGFERYDAVSAFDPDHVPVPRYLDRVLGYFEDESVGYVQAAQVYYNQGASFIARGAAEETYAFYSSTQMVAYGIGSSGARIYLSAPQVIGSHNTHRVAALRDVGGFAPHVGEDLLITFLYWDSGWRGVYVPEILARGIAPVDWDGYLTQQRRWARSFLDIIFRVVPSLSMSRGWKATVVNLVHGTSYLNRPLAIALGVVVLCALLVTGDIPPVVSASTVGYLAIFWGALQLCEFFRQRYYLDPRNEWGPHLRAALLHLAKWPFVLYAIWEVFRHRTSSYHLTPKVRSAPRKHFELWPLWVVASVIAAAWALGRASGRLDHPGVEIFAGLAFALFAGLPFTQLLIFPPPYDPDLRRKAMPAPGGDAGAVGKPPLRGPVPASTTEHEGRWARTRSDRQE